MLKKIPFVWACVASLLFVACSKEKSIDTSTANALLVGNWKFVGFQVTGESIVELSGPGFNTKTVTPSGYYSIDNTGTVTITSNQFISTDISYAIDTSVTGYMYEDGVLTDSITVPFKFSFPPISSTSTYKVIGSDSLYFPTGTFVIDASSGGQTEPAGAKFTLQNDILIMTSHVFEESTLTDNGITQKNTTRGTSTAILQKL